MAQAAQHVSCVLAYAAEGISRASTRLLASQAPDHQRVGECPCRETHTHTDAAGLAYLVDFGEPFLPPARPRGRGHQTRDQRDDTAGHEVLLLGNRRPTARERPPAAASCRRPAAVSS